MRQAATTQLPHIVNESPAFRGIENETPEFRELRANMIETARILREATD